LSDIDITAVNICKQDKGFNPNNVFGYNYQNTIPTFVDEQCFQFDYQNTVVDNFTGMPSKLKNIIKETPEKLFVVCNPPYLFASGANNRKGITEESIITTIMYKELKNQE
jgi:tRNA1(Val) A37 N6-methylase TrmN6